MLRPRKRTETYHIPNAAAKVIPPRPLWLACNDPRRTLQLGESSGRASTGGPRAAPKSFCDRLRIASRRGGVKPVQQLLDQQVLHCICKTDSVLTALCSCESTGLRNRFV